MVEDDASEWWGPHHEAHLDSPGIGMVCLRPLPGERLMARFMPVHQLGRWYQLPDVFSGIHRIVRVTTCGEADRVVVELGCGKPHLTCCCELPDDEEESGTGGGPPP